MFVCLSVCTVCVRAGGCAHVCICGAWMCLQVCSHVICLRGGVHAPGGGGVHAGSAVCMSDGVRTRDSMCAQA